MEGVVQEGLEAVFLIKAPRFVIDGPNLHGMDGHFCGQFGANAQGVQQEMPSQSLPAGVLIDGQPAEMDDGDGVMR